MNKNFSIIHLSDLHYDKKKSTSSSLLVDNIFQDIKSLEEQEGINPKLILFTGDLVNFGGQNELFQEAYNNVVKPLLNKLGLSNDNFIYVPGNHELDRDEVDEDFQAGFVSRIITADIDKENFGRDALTQRSNNFFNFINCGFYQWKKEEVIKNIIVNIDGVSIGISLYNTAWCSSTYSEQDRKKIFMPPILAKQKLKELEDCDFKIAMMHHPIDWYDDENANKVQHTLSQYNLVLCGHKHLEDNKLEQKGPLKTVYSYAHKLLPLKDKESGYSIIKILPNENKLKVYFREYNDKLSAFSTGITSIDQEVSRLKYSEYEIGKKDEIIQSCYRVFSAIKTNFIKGLDELFITNTIESSKKSYDSLFVDFSLTDYPPYSEPTKENSKKDKKNNYHINDLTNLTGEINIYGKKESGKTVFAYSIAKYFLDEFEKYKKIPVVINCKKYGNTNSNLNKIINCIIYDYLNENSDVSKREISSLVDKEMIVLIFDGFEFLTQKQLKELANINVTKYCIKDYNPLVFGEDDKGFIQNEITKEKKNYFIKPYTKNDVRKLVNNVSVIEGDSQYVENVITYFYTTSLPRTPFVVSLIATICAKNKDTIPTNQAKILEQFLENVLEKINPIEQLSRTYDFSNKEDFLSHFAHKLYTLNSFSMSYNDFCQFTLDYHTERGFCLEDSKFDTLFFEKNILVKEDNLVYFRFSCFNYYYLAKFAIKNSDFKNSIINTEKIAINANILFYYTGLKRDDAHMLTDVKNQLNEYVQQNFVDVDIFDQDPIKTNLGLTDDFVEAVKEKAETINQTEKDEITDRGDTSSEYNPKNNIVNVNGQSFDKLLSILGFSIKNCEEVSANLKKESMRVYLKGCRILWNNFRNQMLNFAKEVNLLILQDSENVDEQLKKAFDIFEDLLKITIPIAISQVMLENSATEKMKTIYVEILNECDYNTPEKMLLTFLLLDLNHKDSEKFVRDFINNTNNKNYLMVCLFKLLYNFLYGTMSNNKKLLNPIAECYIKATNSKKSDKGKIIESVKKQDFYDKFLLNSSEISKN